MNQLLHTSFSVSSLAILRSNYTNRPSTDFREGDQDQYLKKVFQFGLSLETHNGKYCFYCRQKEEPDSILLISADWLFSLWNYLTNSRTMIPIVIFNLEKKLNKTYSNTPFPLRRKPTEFGKALKQKELGFYHLAKMEHLGKIFPLPFLVSPSTSVTTSWWGTHPIAIWKSQLSSGPDEIIVPGRSDARGHHLPASPSHHIRLQQRQRGDTIKGVFSSLPPPTGIPVLEKSHWYIAVQVVLSFQL